MIKINQNQFFTRVKILYPMLVSTNGVMTITCDRINFGQYCWQTKRFIKIIIKNTFGKRSARSSYKKKMYIYFLFPFQLFLCEVIFSFFIKLLTFGQMTFGEFTSTGNIPNFYMVLVFCFPNTASN